MCVPATPTSASEFSTEWAHFVLRGWWEKCARDVRGIRVDRVEARLNSQQGLLSTTYIADVFFREGDQKEERKSIFVKVPLIGEASKNFKQVNVREYEMFTNILPQLKKYLEDHCTGFFCMGVPEILYCHYEGDELHDVFVIENLLDAGFSTCSTPDLKTDSLGEDYLRSTLETLAQLHGTGLHFKRDLGGNRGVQGRFPRIEEQIQIKDILASKENRIFLRKHFCAFIRYLEETDPDLATLTTYLRKMETYLFKILNVLDDSGVGNLNTLCHGDAKPNNFLFRKIDIDFDDEELADLKCEGVESMLIDWQGGFLGSLCNDLMWCMFPFFEVNSHDKDLSNMAFEHYFSELKNVLETFSSELKDFGLPETQAEFRSLLRRGFVLEFLIVVILRPVMNINNPEQVLNWYKKQQKYEKSKEKGGLRAFFAGAKPTLPTQDNVFQNPRYMEFLQFYFKIATSLGAFQELGLIYFELMKDSMFGENKFEGYEEDIKVKPKLFTKDWFKSLIHMACTNNESDESKDDEYKIETSKKETTRENGFKKDFTSASVIVDSEIKPLVEKVEDSEETLYEIVVHPDTEIQEIVEVAEEATEREEKEPTPDPLRTLAAQLHSEFSQYKDTYKYFNNYMGERLESHGGEESFIDGDAFNETETTEPEADKYMIRSARKLSHEEEINHVKRMSKGSAWSHVISEVLKENKQTSMKTSMEAVTSNQKNEDEKKIEHLTRHSDTLKENAYSVEIVERRQNDEEKHIQQKEQHVFKDDIMKRPHPDTFQHEEDECFFTLNRISLDVDRSNRKVLKTIEFLSSTSSTTKDKDMNSDHSTVTNSLEITEEDIEQCCDTDIPLIHTNEKNINIVTQTAMEVTPSFAKSQEDNPNTCEERQGVQTENKNAILSWLTLTTGTSENSESALETKMPLDNVEHHQQKYAEENYKPFDSYILHSDKHLKNEVSPDQNTKTKDGRKDGIMEEHLSQAGKNRMESSFDTGNTNLQYKENVTSFEDETQTGCKSSILAWLSLSPEICTPDERDQEGCGYRPFPIEDFVINEKGDEIENIILADHIEQNPSKYKQSPKVENMMIEGTKDSISQNEIDEEHTAGVHSLLTKGFNTEVNMNKSEKVEVLIDDFLVERDFVDSGIVLTNSSNAGRNNVTCGEVEGEFKDVDLDSDDQYHTMADADMPGFVELVLKEKTSGFNHADGQDILIQNVTHSTIKEGCIEMVNAVTDKEPTTEKEDTKVLTVENISIFEEDGKSKSILVGSWDNKAGIYRNEYKPRIIIAEEDCCKITLGKQTDAAEEEEEIKITEVIKIGEFEAKEKEEIVTMRETCIYDGEEGDKNYNRHFEIVEKDEKENSHLSEFHDNVGEINEIIEAIVTHKFEEEYLTKNSQVIDSNLFEKEDTILGSNQALATKGENIAEMEVFTVEASAQNELKDVLLSMTSVFEREGLNLIITPGDTDITDNLGVGTIIKGREIDNSEEEVEMTIILMKAGVKAEEVEEKENILAEDSYTYPEENIIDTEKKINKTWMEEEIKHIGNKEICLALDNEELQKFTVNENDPYCKLEDSSGDTDTSQENQQMPTCDTGKILIINASDDVIANCGEKIKGIKPATTDTSEEKDMTNIDTAEEQSEIKIKTGVNSEAITEKQTIQIINVAGITQNSEVEEIHIMNDTDTAEELEKVKILTQRNTEPIYTVSKRKYITAPGSEKFEWKEVPKNIKGDVNELKKNKSEFTDTARDTVTVEQVEPNKLITNDTEPSEKLTDTAIIRSVDHFTGKEEKKTRDFYIVQEEDKLQENTLEKMSTMEKKITSGEIVISAWEDVRAFVTVGVVRDPEETKVESITAPEEKKGVKIISDGGTETAEEKEEEIKLVTTRDTISGEVKKTELSTVHTETAQEVDDATIITLVEFTTGDTYKVEEEDGTIVYSHTEDVINTITATETETADDVEQINIIPESSLTCEEVKEKEKHTAGDTGISVKVKLSNMIPSGGSDIALEEEETQSFTEKEYVIAEKDEETSTILAGKIATEENKEEMKEMAPWQTQKTEAEGKTLLLHEHVEKKRNNSNDHTQMKEMQTKPNLEENDLIPNVEVIPNLKCIEDRTINGVETDFPESVKYNLNRVVGNYMKKSNDTIDTKSTNSYVPCKNTDSEVKKDSNIQNFKALSITTDTTKLDIVEADSVDKSELNLENFKGNTRISRRFYSVEEEMNKVLGAHNESKTYNELEGSPEDVNTRPNKLRITDKKRKVETNKEEKYQIIDSDGLPNLAEIENADEKVKYKIISSLENINCNQGNNRAPMKRKRTREIKINQNEVDDNEQRRKSKEVFDSVVTAIDENMIIDSEKIFQKNRSVGKGEEAKKEDLGVINDLVNIDSKEYVYTDDSPCESGSGTLKRQWQKSQNSRKKRRSKHLL